ncbi:thiol reductant ABC exporter subunit CydD [Bordetella sp. FB-8]|uniref:thiol reductant ABC exporter subunit CydD n=1 Tax=Bordetella sp. FB-8 TaxID=1159870 RepID=UPI00037D9403|nr:thiol reductant ABC exporter subunit CydD [Bordetella sp. FB-8]
MSGLSGIEHAPQSASKVQSAWLSGQARLARAPLAVAGAAPLLAGALLALQAWLLAGVLDAALVHGASRAQLLRPISSIGCLILLRAVLAWLAERAGARAAETIKHRIRLALFDRLLRAGPQWTRRQVSGELASALVEQTDALEGFFAKYLPAVGAAGVLPVAFSVLVLPQSIVAGLLLFITAPLIPVFMALVGWGAEAASRRHARAIARLSGFFADRLRGLSTLKLYGRADDAAVDVAQASEALRARTMAVLRVAFLSSAVLEFFAALGVAGVALYIGLRYLGLLGAPDPAFGLRAGFFCLLMAPEVYAPLRQFAAHYHDRAAARAAVAEIDRLFDGLPEPGEPVSDTAAQAVAPGVAQALSLTAQALTVDAPGRPQAVLREAQLRLAAGEHVVLMGASGAGKTTLLEALCGLRTARGEILLDGTPLQDWQEPELRARVALIGQKPYLFQGTIADNIRFAKPDASLAEVADAARRACVSEFAQAMPRGLETTLGPRGAGLSGGQAQRVALARLFLRDAGLVLLDEPTAHLDAATQERVIESIVEYARGRSLLLATHSHAVARHFARRLQLVEGSVVQL